jgi:selenocysteine-specific elongation factor
VFPLSSVSGAGVEALDAHLRAQAAAHHARAASGSFRLAVDRVFTLAGIGTVVTGTAHAGRVRVGDEVMVQPGALRTRVRSLRVQDRPAGAGCAGQRCALNLAGVAKEDVRRGTWVQAPELANVSERLDATLRLSLHAPKALSGWTTVHFHHGTEDVMARLAALDADIPGGGSTRGAAAPARSSPAIAPGGEPLITLQLAAPIAVCKGDRFVIRDASASRTLGGGVVLDIAPPARGKRRPDRLQFLRALRELPPTPAFERWLAREPVLLTRLANGWNLRADEIPPLLAAARAQVAGGTAFTASYWDTLRAKALAAVAATHEREPEMPGLEQNRLRRIVAPQLAADVIAELVEGLLHDGQLARRGAFVALPTHKAELAANERVLWERLKPRLLEHPYQPPRVRDIAREMGLVETEVRAVLKRVARVGEVTLVAHDHYFLSDAVRAMADIAAELAQTQGAARAAPFRDRIGGGRKVAIQILEFFDRVGYTRRVRDDHVLRRDNPWRQTTPSSPSAREREKTS